MNPQVDTYLADGCGRCPLVGTPQCKVRKWQPELHQLRRIVLDCGLTEELKWSMPCYTHEGHNIAMIAAFKDSCVLSFFKGSLLHDEHDILEKSGENSHVARLARFTQAADILRLEPVLKDYLYEAIEVERSGQRPARQDISTLQWPEELLLKMEEIPALKAAFQTLSPGRQRGYILYFSAPKQSKTRTSRIEKHILRIMSGQGIHD